MLSLQDLLSSTTNSSLPLLIITALLLSLTALSAYRLFFHPLSRLPGPVSAALSSLFLALHVRSGNSHTFLPSLHARFGPVVRIAPNWVLVSDEEAVKRIYSRPEFFEKGAWYRVCEAPDSRSKSEDRFNLLSETNRERYRMQRRAIGPVYSAKGVERHDALLSSYIERYVGVVRGLEGRSVDLVEWMHIYALDALAMVTLGKTAGYTEKGNDGGNMVGSDLLWRYFTLVGLFPWLFDAMMAFPKLYIVLSMATALALGIRSPPGLPVFGFAVPNVLARLKDMESTRNMKMPADRPGLVLTGFGEIKETKRDDEDDDGQDADMLDTLMKQHADKKAKFHPAWVLGIAMTNFGAGHDTMTTTLTGLFYNIGMHPAVQARLSCELREQNITKESSYTEIVNRVPYMLAVLKESLRMYPIIGFMLPRIVPASGLQIGDHVIPPGTTVAASMYATHHSPSIFPDPGAFSPERWMPDGTEEKEARIRRMDAIWMGFGGMTRSCPGQWLARWCVFRVVAALLVEFDVEVEGELTIRGWFSAHLGGVKIRFKERV